MRRFVRRFIRALRTIPRRVRWILITPAAFIALCVIDGRLAISVVLVVLGWLVAREILIRPKRGGAFGDLSDQSNRSHANRNNDSYDINPTTGLPMDKASLVDSGGYFYGEEMVSSDHRDH
jgi:hypothetical protein